MDRDKVLKQLDRDRRHLARDGEVLDVLPDLTRLRAADGSHHTVIYAALDEHTADAAIAREVAHHRGLGVPFEWKHFAHDGPADMLRRLERSGFEIGPCEAVLVYDLSDVPPWANVPEAAAVVRVDRLEQVSAYRAVAEAVVGKDYAFTAGQLAEAIRAGSTQHRGYIALAPDGTPAAVGRLYTHPDSAFAGLYGGGTLPSHRGQGLYRATVAARACDAVALGARYLLVDALPTSRPILERLGFRWLTDTWPCEWRP